MTRTNISDLRDNLSRYLRRVEAGERIAVTLRGRVIAELGPSARARRMGRRTQYENLVAAGIIRPPLESGDPLADWPTLRLPARTAAYLIEADRGES